MFAHSDLQNVDFSTLKYLYSEMQTDANSEWLKGGCHCKGNVIKLPWELLV